MNRYYFSHFQTASFPRRRESSLLLSFLDFRLRRNNGVRRYRILLRYLCLFLLLLSSLTAHAQGARTLVLTNLTTQTIWIDKVLFGDEELPAGYLPAKGRMYLILGTQDVRTLLLRWHISPDDPQQQQTIRIGSNFNSEQKKARFLVVGFDGQSFFILQDE